MANNKRTIFCKHYHGMQNPCDVGVDFDAVKSGNLKLPCFDSNVKTCSKVLYPTAEEIAQEDKEIGDMLLRVTTARKLIVEATHGKKSVSGHINCPVCSTGTLSYSVAYNGHVHARCSTQDCLNWLE